MNDKPEPQDKMNDYDPLDPQDPHRREIQPPIPTHPPDPAAQGETDKVVAPATPAADPATPAPVSTGVSSGEPIDHVGGAGLGVLPGDGDAGTPAGTRDRDVKADDQQDRR